MPFVAVATIDNEDADCEDASAVISLKPKKSSSDGGSGGGSRGSKKAQRTGSNIYSAFSQKQIEEFKEAFRVMDDDKDGIIGKCDLRTTYNAVGSLPPDDEQLEEMLREGCGQINFTMLLILFANKMSGPADDDDVVINSFKYFDESGKIDAEKLRTQLVTFGDTFSEAEVNAVFDNLDVDDEGLFETRQIIAMLTGSADDNNESAAASASAAAVGSYDDADEEVTFTL